METPAGTVPRISSKIRFKDHFGTFLVRTGFVRTNYRVTPGVHAVGNPGPDSPVIVTANYKLTFDVVRRDLAGTDVWLLVIDTRGINVWCAAGKSLFSTDEVIRKIRSSGLEKLVGHRSVILPQLGAPGVAAHEVRKATGFKVKYGPVRSSDLKAFIENGLKTTDDMRAVSFTLKERAELIPIEIVMAWRWILLALLLFVLLGGIGPWGYDIHAAWSRGWDAFLTGLAGFLGGTALAPLLMSRLPGRMFWLHGALLGAIAAACTAFMVASGPGPVLIGTAAGSFMMMNFTGSTPFTSPTGVEHEMKRGIPFQLGAALLGLALWIAMPFITGGA
jgi:hypothetical protein